MTFSVIVIGIAMFYSFKAMSTYIGPPPSRSNANLNLSPVSENDKSIIDGSSIVLKRVQLGGSSFLDMNTTVDPDSIDLDFVDGNTLTMLLPQATRSGMSDSALIDDIPPAADHDVGGIDVADEMALKMLLPSRSPKKKDATNFDPDGSEDSTYGFVDSKAVRMLRPPSDTSSSDATPAIPTPFFGSGSSSGNKTGASKTSSRLPSVDEAPAIPKPSFGAPGTSAAGTAKPARPLSMSGEFFDEIPPAIADREK
jgi:hypothetical protein